jgi:hypothetical protein
MSQRDPNNSLPDVPPVPRVGSGRPPLHADYDAPPLIRYGARVVLHADQLEAARDALVKATRKFKADRTPKNKKKVEERLAALRRAEARLARSAWRMRQAVEQAAKEQSS